VKIKKYIKKWKVKKSTYIVPCKRNPTNHSIKSIEQTLK
jgi:hypothetical protein